MGSISLTNPTTRAIVSFGAVAAGTAVGCATGSITGGLPGGAALAVAGLFGNIWAGELARLWEERGRDPKYAHPNDDLTRLTGKAIALVLYQSARAASSRSDARWFRSLAKQAKGSYHQIAAQPDLQDIRSDHLPEIFAAAASWGEATPFLLLDEPTWKFVVEQLRDHAGAPENDPAALIAARNLHQGVFVAVRELFKRDFCGDGRAYAALCLDMNASILSRLGDLLMQQQDRRAELISIREWLAEIGQRHWQQLTAQQMQDLAWLLNSLQALNGKLDSLVQVSVRIDGRTEKMDERLDAIDRLLRELISQKHAGDDPTQRQLSPQLIEQARLLLERGNQEQQAVAEIALKNHTHADALIQQLKRASLAETFRLLMLEGDNWYQAGEFDKAVGPYEQARSLRPENVGARNNVALSHALARLGDISAHRRHAIRLFRGTLRLVASNSLDWAMTQNNLGIAWHDLPTGDRDENLRMAIQAYRAALTVYTHSAHPVDWAMTQNNLGVAWRSMATGDRSENLRMAIHAYEAALKVYTLNAHPVDWAMTQNNLGTVWHDLPTGDRGENLRIAIQAYEAALKVYTPSTHPISWAGTQNNLGAAWLNMPTGDRDENLSKAIQAYDAALTVYTPTNHPVGWAGTQHNLAIAVARLADIRIDSRCELLRRAISSGKAALLVRTRTAFPDLHASTTRNLETDRAAYDASGCGKSLPFEAIRPAD